MVATTGVAGADVAAIVHDEIVENPRTTVVQACNELLLSEDHTGMRQFIHSRAGVDKGEDGTVVEQYANQTTKQQKSTKTNSMSPPPWWLTEGRRHTS